MFLSCTIFTLNVHISICFCVGFRHAHICTNDYPYYSCIGFCHAHLRTNDYPYFFYGFLSCTFMYKWLSIFLLVFVMHIFLQSTIHILFFMGSCTSLYLWLSIFLWVFVMHIFLQMTIHIIFVLVFVMHKNLYEWLFCSQYLSNAFL